MVCTASLISVLVALGATWKTSVFWFSLISRPFSVITGRRIIWYADFILLSHLRRFFMLGATPRSRGRFLRAFVFVFAGLVLPLRSRLLQRNLQLLYGRLREDHAVVAQQMIRMHLAPAHQFQPVDIARAQCEVAILVLGFLDDQNRLVDFQRVQQLLARESVVVGTRLRTMHRVAMPP